MFIRGIDANCAGCLGIIIISHDLKTNPLCYFLFFRLQGSDLSSMMRLWSVIFAFASSRE